MEPDSLNNIVQTVKAFGVVPVSFDTLIDLDKEKVYDGIILQNNTDVSITFKFTNDTISSEVVIESTKELVLDNFKHWDIIQYKYTSGAPTSGNVVHFSW